MWKPSSAPANDRPPSGVATADQADVLSPMRSVGTCRIIAARRSSGTVARFSAFKAAVVLIPEKNVGFSIEINSEDGEIDPGLDVRAARPLSWSSERRLAREVDRLTSKQMTAKGLKKYQSRFAKPVKAGPSLPLAATPGPMSILGTATSKSANANEKLTIDFKSTPRMSGTLDHWQYDTFITRFTDKTIEPAYVTFSLDADGKIDRITMKAVSPLADFSWDYQDLLFRPADCEKMILVLLYCLVASAAMVSLLLAALSRRAHRIAAQIFDVIIKGGTVYDGSGAKDVWPTWLFAGIALPASAISKTRRRSEY